MFSAKYHATPIGDTINTLNSNSVDSAEFYDGTQQYAVNVADSHFVHLEDFPSQACPGTSAEIQIASAEDYIRFKPGKFENDGNIYVTLGIVRWSAHGEYSRTLGWITNSTPAASPPDNSSAFPFWDTILVP